MSDTEIGEHTLPQSLQVFHRLLNDVDAIRDLARAAVAEIAEVVDSPDAEFDHHVPKVLMTLALLDHMTDRRTVGSVCDYLNF